MPAAVDIPLRHARGARDAVGALASGTRSLVRGRAEYEVCSDWVVWRRGGWYFKSEALILLSFLLLRALL